MFIVLTEKDMLPYAMLLIPASTFVVARVWYERVVHAS